MIKGMDIMALESAKFAFDRDKSKYSSSEHLERYRQIQISRGYCRLIIILVVGVVPCLPILVGVVCPRLLLARTPQTKLQWQLLLMVSKKVTNVTSLITAMSWVTTTAKKATRMMMTTRMTMAAMTPPTM
jgi:hypothetical protein